MPHAGAAIRVENTFARPDDLSSRVRKVTLQKPEHSGCDRKAIVAQPTGAGSQGRRQSVLNHGTLHHINAHARREWVRACGFENVRLMKRLRSLVFASKSGTPPAMSVRATMAADRQRLSLVFLIAIVALLFQSLLTGSHIHTEVVSGRTDNPSLATVASVSHHSPSKSGGCPICREIAQAGQYVASAPPHFEIGTLPGFWLSPTVARPVARHSISHAWQSRGPPQARSL